MVEMKPNVVVVFGTGILKGDILSRFEGQLLNIHLGLSPYYRGAGTNFWPLVNGEPEFVGATIHYLDAGIDTGPIIAHVRPDIARTDGPHELGNKAIRAAAEGMVKAVKAAQAAEALQTAETLEPTEPAEPALALSSGVSPDRGPYPPGGHYTYRHPRVRFIGDHAYLRVDARCYYAPGSRVSYGDRLWVMPVGWFYGED